VLLSHKRKRIEIMANEKPPNQPKSKEEMERVCDKCNGTGKISYPEGKREVDCPKCHGKGWVL
jgi:DnaJ-class molecular chaperone